jgi:hypothetical protein
MKNLKKINEQKAVRRQPTELSPAGEGKENKLYASALLGKGRRRGHGKYKKAANVPQYFMDIHSLFAGLKY